MWNLLSPHAPLAVGLPGSKCSHRLCLPGLLRDTRLAGRRNLLLPLHPIDRVAESVIFARAAGSRLARGQMLSRSLARGQRTLA